MNIKIKVWCLFICLLIGCENSKDKKIVEYYSSGTIKRISWIDKNYKLNGPVFEYYENGKIRDIFFLRNNIIQGVYLEYNIMGGIVKYQTYSDNKLNGKSVLFNKNSRYVLSISDYVNDTLSGMHLSFYESNGGLKEKFVYNKGKPVYEIYIYSENGKIGQYQYRNTKGDIYLVKNYYNDGKPIKTMGHHITQVYVKDSKNLNLSSNIQLGVLLANPPDELNKIIITEVSQIKEVVEFDGAVKKHHMLYVFKPRRMGNLNFKITLLNNQNVLIDQFSFALNIK